MAGTLLCIVVTSGAPAGTSTPRARTPAPGTDADADADGCFVDAAHVAFLGRPATGAEVRWWVVALRGTTPRSALPASLARSEEWLGVEVDTLYQRALDRDPEPAGAAFWTEQLRRGGQVGEVARSIYGSEEFFVRAGATPGAYVTDLYARILSRAPDAAGLAHWRDRLESRGRGWVAKAFLDSFESRSDRVRRLYQRLLGREPDRAGHRYWARRLRRVNDVTLASSLASSHEFHHRSQSGCALPLAVVTSALPIASVDEPYDGGLEAIGGTPPYTWRLDNLPDGLRAAGGRIVGTPSSSGATSLGVTVTDAEGASVTVSVTLTVAPSHSAGAAVVRGYGAWVDVFDWTASYSGGQPAVTTASIDRMHAEGVRTLYLQTARWTTPANLVEESRARALIARAKAHGMRVVAWYLPTLTDTGADLRRLVASARLPVDAIGVNIESVKVDDVDLRNQRIVDVSASLQAVVDKPMIAIPLNPVAIEDIVPGYWPAFPWRALTPYYHAWMPMAYWSYREPGSYWRDPYRYTRENILRVRRNIGDPGAVVSPIGSPTSAGDIAGMIRAIDDTGATGGSVYDWATTPSRLYASLRPLRTR